MGLLVMILGLVLFLGIHTLPAQRELRARVIATYIRRRSSSRPSDSIALFSCGNSPSSRPVMNTAVNSSPFAA